MTLYKETRRGQGWILGMIFPVMLFLLASVSRADEKSALLGEIETILHEKLSHLISDEVELTGLRIIRGGEIIHREGPSVIKSAVMNGYNGRNKAVFLITVSNEEKDSSLLIETAYDVPVDVFVTSRPLMSGTILTENDFYTVKQKSSRIPAGALLNKDELEGKALRASLGQGIILKTNHVNAPASGKRGQKVDVVVEGNNVSISTKGVLRNDAVLGGTAKVWCDSSKKEIYGILVAPTMVKVKI
ncbi:MAG: flagellar basal body P-ring formation chaperone FlgA [Nitrospirota bacterium]